MARKAGADPHPERPERELGRHRKLLCPPHALRLLGDAANQKKYHDIEFGLLNSIVRNGDGKTNRTGWSVVQVKEEYFILQMLGAKVLKQSVDPVGPCDRMEVETSEGPKTYYFNVTKVFEGYGKLGLR